MSSEGKIFRVSSKSCLNEAKEIYIASNEPAKTEMFHIKWFLLFSVEVKLTETENGLGVMQGTQQSHTPLTITRVHDEGGLPISRTYCQ